MHPVSESIALVVVVDNPQSNGSCTGRHLAPRNMNVAQQVAITRDYHNQHLTLDKSKNEEAM